MTDWFKKMTTLIDESEEETNAPLIRQHSLTHQALFKKSDKSSRPFFNKSPAHARGERSYSERQNSSIAPSKDILKEDFAHSDKASKANQEKVEPAKDKPMTASEQSEKSSDNFKALQRLRELPRGTQVESRIAAIEALLGEKEVFKSLKHLRWPQGVICPRCHSSNVARRDPPPNAIDQRHYYICLNCKGEGGVSDFDDFTGLPIGSMHALRQWIFCWYLIGFCSVHQIAKVLGLSAQEVMQMASYGAELTQLPDNAKDSQYKDELRLKEKKSREEARKGIIEKDQDLTHSESRSPLKPGYKSKK